MSLIEMLCIAISLASDAFAVSLCKGMSIKNIRHFDCLKIALYFSIFQMIMPVLGFIIGTKYAYLVLRYSRIIVFVLLIFIAFKMISECNSENNVNPNLDIKEMVILSIATSIDALAVGLSFALLNIHITLPVILIGIVTFIMCLFGSYIGNKIGDKYKNKAELLGGMLLIIIAFKILL